MKRDVIHEFVRAVEGLGDKEYLYAVLLYNISPVIAGVKPASIITFNKAGRNLKLLWELYSGMLLKENRIKYFEISNTNFSTTLIFYDAVLLEKVLKDEEISNFYYELGYKNISDIEGMLYQMKFRYVGNCPHEMGVLLGIPVDDVREFMNNKSKKCLACGYWKVYNNVERANEVFKAYDHIREKAIYSIIKDAEI
ncbi:MAG: DUF3793 family protein [Bacillota bacterium]|nr:DUF3793 family protein [Bacillota bacterium]